MKVRKTPGGSGSAKRYLPYIPDPPGRRSPQE
jgi:hypothetical protein